MQSTPKNLRINVAINDLEKREINWFEVFDFLEQGDIFEIQDILATLVVKELELKFTIRRSGTSYSQISAVYKRQLLGWLAFQ